MAKIGSLERAGMNLDSLRLRIKYRLARWRGTVCARTDRFELLLDTSLAEDVGQVLSLRKNLCRRTWEAGLIDAFFRHIPQDAVIVELGAWIGVYTVILAKHVAPRGRVFAFEPDPAAFHHCVVNLHRNQVTNAWVLPLAVSDRPCRAELYNHRRFGNSGSTLTRAAAEAQGGTAHYTMVNALRLTEILDALACTPTVVKIDIEGAEDLALAGATRLLANPDLKVFLELHPDHLRRKGVSARSVLEVLADAGKTIRFIDSGDPCPYAPDQIVDPASPYEGAVYRVLAA